MNSTNIRNKKEKLIKAKLDITLPQLLREQAYINNEMLEKFKTSQYKISYEFEPTKNGYIVYFEAPGGYQNKGINLYCICDKKGNLITNKFFHSVKEDKVGYIVKKTNHFTENRYERYGCGNDIDENYLRSDCKCWEHIGLSYKYIINNKGEEIVSRFLEVYSPLAGDDCYYSNEYGYIFANDSSEYYTDYVLIDKNFNKIAICKRSESGQLNDPQLFEKGFIFSNTINNNYKTITFGYMNDKLEVQIPTGKYKYLKKADDDTFIVSLDYPTSKTPSYILIDKDENILSNKYTDIKPTAYGYIVENWNDELLKWQYGFLDKNYQIVTDTIYDKITVHDNELKLSTITTTTTIKLNSHDKPKTKTLKQKNT